MTLLKQMCSHKTYLMWIKGSMVTMMFNGMCLLATTDLVLSQLGLEVLEVSPQITLPLLVGLVNFGAPVLNHVTKSIPLTFHGQRSMKSVVILHTHY